MPNNDLIIEIKANTKQALKEIEQLKKEIKSFSESVRKGDINLKESEKTIASFTKRLTDMAHAYVGFQAVRGVVGIVADFEQSIAKLGAISGASSGNLEKLKAKAEELGKSTMFSASEVAEGMNYLAMAGYKTKDILASINDVLNLAAVGQISLAQASDIATNILSGFNLKAEDTKRVVDIMTATITNANTNIPELGEAMKYVAPQASALGVSLEETSAAIAVLSNSGIKATMAGTGLSAMLAKLASPTGAAADAIEKLGIKIYDSKGKFIGLENVLKQFYEKTKNMSQEMKQKYIRDIFGLETMKTALTLINSMSGAYQNVYSKIAKSLGITEEKVKQITDTYKGHMKELESALQALAITVGNELLPALTKFVEWLTKAVQNTESFYKENKTLINTLVELTAIFVGLGKLRAIIESVLGVKAAIEISRSASSVAELKKAFIALGTAIMKLGKANAILIALTLAITGINYALDRWEERIERVNKATRNLNESTKDFNNFLNEIKKYMDGAEIKASAEELKKLKDITQELTKANEERIKKLRELLKVGTHDNKAVKRELDALIERNKQLKAWYDKLKNTKPYDKTKESAKEAENAVRKLTEAEKKELEEIKNTYTKRIKAHKNSIKQLEAQEKALANRIIEINKQLQEKLKSIENSRILDIESIENRIKDLQLSGASDYAKYLEIKKRADEAYARAKQELEKGNFTLAKHYMSEYENLIGNIADKEIKENGRVVVSKQEANNVAISALKKLESLTNEYYENEKERARTLANEKLQQLKAQLETTKAQLQLELQRLNLEKQMIELLTGKKVNIDTTEALNAVKKLNEEIKNVDEKIKIQKKVKVTADTQDLNKKVDEALNKTPKKTEINVKANTKKAKEEVYDLLILVDKKTGKEQTIIINSDTKEAVSKINEFDNKVKNLKPKVRVKSDVSEAIRAINSIPKTITTIHYIKTIETHAAGGIIGKYSTGGMPEFRRIRGKIPGYDPFDSDDVPALLTRGEFVIKRDAVKHYGEDFLWRLNSKLLPKFATGGLVNRKNVSEYIRNSTNYNEDDLTSKLDNMINSLKDIANKLRGSKKEKEISSSIKIIEKDKKEYAKAKSEIAGKTLSEDEYRNKIKKIKKIEQKAENDIKKAEKLIEKLNRYLEEVERYKELIRNRLSKIGIDEGMILPDNFDYVMDLDRLKKFYNNFVKAKIPNPENIRLDFQRFAYKTLQTEPKYLSAGYSLVNNPNYHPVDYKALADSFLRKYGVRDDLLEYRFTNLLKYNRTAATLSEDNLKILMQDILKKRLPKFQTGGLFALQNGGKLPGYGGGDRNLALLEDGEFVIRKEAVKAFGVDLFAKLNNLKLPKFQTGGFVSNLPSVSSKPAGEMNVNLTLPSGNTYNLITSEEVANKLAQELKRIM